jgi:hypothetical protein
LAPNRSGKGDLSKLVVVVSGAEPITNVLAFSEARQADDPHGLRNTVECFGRFSRLVAAGFVVVLEDEALVASKRSDRLLRPLS